ncbi:MAG: ABC transporter ATP-binding protein [Treponema sp.]
MAFNSYKQDEDLKATSRTKTLLRLFSYLLRHKKTIIIVLAIMAFCTAVGIMNPLFMEWAIDDYISVKNFKGLIKLIALALSLNLLMVVAVKVRMFIMSKLSNKVLLEIRDELYTHIQKLDLKFFDSRPTGKILARIIGDINSLRDVLENSVTTVLPNLVTIISVVVIMFSKNAKLALASLSTLPLMIVLIVLIQVKSEQKWRIVRKKSSNLNAFLHEDLSGIKVVQSFNAEKETDAEFDDLVGQHRKSFVDAVKIADWFFATVDLCWGLGTFALYFVGIKILGTDSISIGTYVAFGTYIGMFWQPIQNLSNFYNQLVTNISGAERVFEIMDTKPEITDKQNAAVIPSIKGEVEFRNVSFAYDKKNVLHNVSFKIKPGETIALVGPTGAGKTTVVNLISRFYDASQGDVLIDGHNIKNVTIESLRKQMGVMTQDNYLFSGTVKENIRYGKLDATDDEIISAAKSVHADDFISKLKGGYDTVLTERGGGLSNGQKQLLAFARTMVSMPKILILDEATSSIDTQTEILIQKGIASLLKGRTSFVIAHRLSTIQNADRIFVVDDGHIVEEGTPSSLMAKKGLYYNLYMAQFSSK